MRLDIVSAGLNLKGNIRVGAVLVDTHNKVFIHSMIDGSKLWNGFTLHHALNIGISHPISCIGRNTSVDRLPDAQRSKTGAAYNGLEQGR